MIEYHDYRLGDLCKRFSSGKGITSELISDSGTYPVIGGNGLRGYTDTYNFDGECAVIGRQGAYCGNVQYFIGKGYMTEHAVVTEPNDDTNAKYLTYKLSGLQLGRFSGQAAQPGLSVTKLARLRIEMPPKWYQDEVAAILSTYDNLIEVNTKRIKVLEQMAENLYKEWFVRFRFPGYETAEFENGLPKGWNVKRCKDIVPIITGKKDANYGNDGGAYPFFTCAQEPIQAPDYSFDCSAVLLAGNCDLNVKIYKGKFEAYQRTYVLSPYNEINLYLLYYVIKNNVDQLKQASTGAAISFITKGMIERIYVIIPDNGVLLRFNEIIDNLFMKKNCLAIQNENLIRQRDLLLPRLMGGKLEVQ